MAPSIECFFRNERHASGSASYASGERLFWTACRCRRGSWQVSLFSPCNRCPVRSTLGGASCTNCCTHGAAAVETIARSLAAAGAN